MSNGQDSRGVNKPRVRRSRLSIAASAVMIVLGLIPLNLVDVYVGLILIALGVAMYLVSRRLSRTDSSPQQQTS